MRIHIDAEMETSYDQMFITYPIVFPTITFKLKTCMELQDRLPAEEYYLTVYGVEPGVENCIVTEEDEQIDLSDDERLELFKQIDAEYRKYFGQSLEERLREVSEEYGLGWKTMMKES